LKNRGNHINHLHRLLAGIQGVQGVHGIAGVVISIAHLINLSVNLLYVQPETSNVLLNAGINDWNLATSLGAAVAAQSDIACAQCSRYSAALIVAQLLLVNHECDKLDNSDKNAHFCAVVNQDIPLILELTLLIFELNCAGVRCHATTRVASVQTP
jgi:hypothetical protein